MAVRMLAAVFRFIHNCTLKLKHHEKTSGNFSVKELDTAENFILRKVQQKSFSGSEDNQIKSLKPKYEYSGLIRIDSRVSNKPNETVNFKSPIILPRKHPVVVALIMVAHRKNCHVGTQGSLCLLGERYWILMGRKTIRSVIRKCTVCRRYGAKPIVVEPPPLPADEVRDGWVG
ncbi:hypothetical protein JTB14_027118 [Gonioctena quinquepunctata]|nr:hypothetical protein JTB14_027118 [Gonioctena quinquepunctata]